MTDPQTPHDAEPARRVGTLTVTGAADLTMPFTDLTFSDGRVVRLPTHMLLAPAESAKGHSETDRGNGLVIPLVEEQLRVDKRTAVTGRVRIHKVTEAHPEFVEQVLNSTAYEVERVTVNEYVSTLPPVRTEGETIVYPVCEEQLAMSKRLVLKEEIRVTRRQSERTETHQVSLLRDRVTVERSGPGSSEVEGTL